MVAILDLPEARDRVVRWSVEEYERFVELGAFRKNVELIRGIIVYKMSKSPLHRFVSLALYDLLSSILPVGFFALHESPLKLSDSEPEPDIAVVRGHKAEYRDRHPTSAALIIEVAVSSALLDRENANLYAEAGVEEYWIVLPKLRQVEVYRELRGGVYASKLVCESTVVLDCASVPGVTVDLNELFKVA
jgi:Uma2 family endonuclease